MTNANYHQTQKIDCSEQGSSCRFGWRKLLVGAGVAVLTLECLFLPLASVTNAQSPANLSLDRRTKRAMIVAMEDEYAARALYAAVIAKFGAVAPFSNIVQSEGKHIEHLSRLFQRYGVPLPVDRFAGRVSTPQTLQAACQAGVNTEIANSQMYNRFLSFVQEPDIRTTFTQLSSASSENHLPAFQRCAGLS